MASELLKLHIMLYSGLLMADFYPDLFQNLYIEGLELPMYRRLFELLRQNILTGRLTGGEKLPSSRELSRQLSISRNTIKTAYEQLIAEGYVQSRQGAGSFVTELPAELLQSETNTGGQAGDGKKCLPELSAKAHRLLESQSMYPPDRLLLQPAVPSLQDFPRKRWKRCMSSAADNDALYSLPAEGYLPLREQISRHLSIFRGIRVLPEQILITSGSQQGSYMIASLLTGQGDPVLLETPGYPGTEGVVRAAGAEVQHIHWQALQQAELPDTGRLLFITPSRNFPLGHTLPLSARLEILHWAEQKNSWVVEDDYDSEFAAGAPVSALFALSQEQRVIYTGSFSRTMFPGLRLGYMVLPEVLVPLFRKARRFMDGGLSAAPQVAMARFMEQGDYSRHIKQLRQLYQQRRQSLEDLLSKSSLSHLPIIDAGAGMHLVIKLPDDCDDQALVDRLVQQGVGVRALSHYGLSAQPVRGLVVGFTLDEPQQMAKGVKILEQAVQPFCG